MIEDIEGTVKREGWEVDVEVLGPIPEGAEEQLGVLPRSRLDGGLVWLIFELHSREIQPQLDPLVL